MEKDNFILISLDDPRAKKIAKIVGNKTSHKILSFLEENPKKSEQDISTSLKIPLNTIDYNIKQLLESGLIEKSSNFFWSKKGKKISLYKVSNKSVIFSPKKINLSSKLRLILPVSLLSGIGALIIRLTHQDFSTSSQNFIQQADMLETLTTSTKEMVSNSDLAGSGLISSSGSVFSLGSPAWWFIGGVLLSLVVFILVNSVSNLEKTYSSKKEKIESRKEVKNEI